MATLSNNDIARAIYLSVKGKIGGEQIDALKSVVSMLSKRRLLHKSSVILDALKKISDEEEGRLEVKVWSKHKIQENDKKELVHWLKEKYGNKEIVLQERIDEGVLGGFKIEIGSELIDLTLRNKIYKLQTYLNKSHE